MNRVHITEQVPSGDLIDLEASRSCLVPSGDGIMFGTIGADVICVLTHEGRTYVSVADDMGEESYDDDHLAGWCYCHSPMYTCQTCEAAFCCQESDNEDGLCGKCHEDTIIFDDDED
jgi:hypothetical protein